MRSKGWSESTLSGDGASSCPPWCFRLRFSNKAPSFDDIMAAGPSSSKQKGSSTMTSLTLREKISRAAEAFLELRAQNLPLQFYMSTLNGPRATMAASSPSSQGESVLRCRETMGGAG